MGLVTLYFDLLTLKLVCESHQRWGTFIPNLGTLGLWVLQLFAMYATDGRTKANLIAPSYGRGRNNFDKLMYVAYVAVIIFYIIRCHLITTNSKLSDCFASSDYITYVP